VLAHGSRVKSEKVLGRIAQWQEDVGHDTMELVELKLVLQIRGHHLRELHGH
jgi:hypothetical protein